MIWQRRKLRNLREHRPNLINLNHVAEPPNSSSCTLALEMLLNIHVEPTIFKLRLMFEKRLGAVQNL